MKIDWKLLSYAMFISVIIIWVCASIVSVFFIQPLLDMLRNLPIILSGNASCTFTGSKLPNIPLWILLVISLLLWSVLTGLSYVIMKALKKTKTERTP
ncbi:MAG TPA: hypothetical protein HA258_05025 [Thermoplasmata archaeon]|nr:hypothetical protein [Thermoplasmata archaeon]HIH29050.1 hypothetical protein [Thermoplasmata archaeon]